MVITRNVDLSVEATIGLVAYVVAVSLEQPHARRARRDRWSGSASGWSSGWSTASSSRSCGCPAIVATLGTLSIFRGIDYLIAGSHQVPLAGLPDGLHRRRPATTSSASRSSCSSRSSSSSSARSSCARRRFGRQVYAVGSNPEAAAILGIPSRRVVFAAFAAVRPAGRRRRRHVGHRVRDDQRDVRDRRRCSRSSPRSSSAGSTSSAAPGRSPAPRSARSSSASSPTP